MKRRGEESFRLFLSLPLRLLTYELDFMPIVPIIT